jgi:choline dehydrogenase-like flavoprotein
VLDARLRVRGVSGLRVADGSALPFLPAINPCITTMMIGEKCADMLKEDAPAGRPAAAVPAGG